MTKIQGEVKIHNKWVSSIQRKHMLIENFSYWIQEENILKILDSYRIYLQIVSLSDIKLTDKKQVLKAPLNDHKLHKLLLHQPKQEKPHKEY